MSPVLTTRPAVNVTTTDGVTHLGTYRDKRGYGAHGYAPLCNTRPGPGPSTYTTREADCPDCVRLGKASS